MQASWRKRAEDGEPPGQGPAALLGLKCRALGSAQASSRAGPLPGGIPGGVQPGGAQEPQG